ncbi:hypothetical protein V8C35DRAFT_329820 [Trichoderma chlorosporum]
MDINATYQQGFLQDCIYHCYRVPGDDSQSKNPIRHHWEVGSAGSNYYYCVPHRVFHCMVSTFGVDQPCCGECAPAYYSKEPQVTWMRQNDYHVSFRLTSSNFVEMVTGDDDSDGAPVDLRAVLALPSDVLDDGSALEEDPRYTLTSRDLGSITMAHRRHPGLILMKFTDYDGLPGWITCGRDMSRESFAFLSGAERDGDPVMKDARLWACQLLGIALPQDIRWTLWSIYMLSNRALADAHPAEREKWHFRSWLYQLYTRFDELAVYYQLDASSPDEDWFDMPASTSDPAANDDAEDDVSAVQRNTPASPEENDSKDESFLSDDENNDDRADSGNRVSHSESSSTETSSSESSSTETSSSSSETVVQESIVSMTELATTLASIDEDEDADADINQ